MEGEEKEEMQDRMRATKESLVMPDAGMARGVVRSSK
jgi:hypothetical protein